MSILQTNIAKKHTEISLSKFVGYCEMRSWRAYIIYKKHRRKIKHHIIDVICASGKVRVFTLGKRNIINYDELEQEIKRILKEKNKY